MVNSSKKNNQSSWKKWKESGAIGNINGKDFGEAYAFFDCGASQYQIAKEIPAIRELVKTPKKLELYLVERSLPVIKNSCSNKPANVDSELIEIARDADESGIRYVLAARSPPNITNHQTADELAAILNQAYQSSLYQESEQFRGEVVYKYKGKYLFRE